MEGNWIDILPQLMLAGGGFLIFCVGAFWEKRPSLLLFGMALVLVAVAGAAAIFSDPKAPQFLGMIEVGGYARFVTLLISLITLLTLLFVYQYAKIRRFGGDEFYGLILFAALGMIVVAGAIHWVTFFLGLEVLSLSLYVLIAVRKGEPRSNEAGLKYFLLGAVASAFLTFGIAMIYGVTGTMNIAQSLILQGETGRHSVMLLGLGLILVGIGFKISLVPFHLWTPDVYQGAPAPVTAFLTAGSKVALFAALLRFVHYFSMNGLWVHAVPVLWAVAALTMVVGNISALTQSQVKRLLAYSSIAHMGYLMMALLAVRQDSAPAILFYLTVYALMDLGAFGILGTLSFEKTDRDALEEYEGLGYSHPWQCALFALCLFSLAGLPPTGGFIGKFALFQATLQGRFVVLAVIGIITVIISIYFYLKVIVSLYMRPAEKVIISPEGGLLARIAGTVVVVLVLLLGIVPAPVFTLITRVLPPLALWP